MTIKMLLVNIFFPVVQHMPTGAGGGGNADHLARENKKSEHYCVYFCNNFSRYGYLAQKLFCVDGRSYK